MSATGRDAPAQSSTADREIVISRVISASRELVFEAFTDVRHLSRWWGPEGFTPTTRAFEFRVGAAWDFVMHGPDGTDYQDRTFRRSPGHRRASRALMNACAVPNPSRW